MTGLLQRAGIAAAKGLTTTIIFFVVVEMLLRGAYLARNAMVRYVPLPYALGDDYGPVPPWLDRLLILRPDDALIWRSLPDVRRTYVDIFSPIRTEQDRVALLRRFLPGLPAAFRANPTWSIALNGEGFRSDAFGGAPKRGTLRIACIGDSWTFGMNVDQDRTYPARVAALLRERPSAGDVEVMNFGVLGYSSFQGRVLLEQRVLDLHPDIVAIGFGMNDSEVAGYRDKDMVMAGEPPRLGARVLDAARDSELFKLLSYAALALRFHQKPIGDFLREEAETKGSGDVDYDAIEPWTRVSPRDYDANVRAMIAASRAHGAAVLLLDNELWAESPYRPILKRIANEEEVPLVDSLSLIAKARTQIERDLERRLQLAPAAPPAAPAADAGATGAPADTTVVFRVSRGTAPVPGAISIVGTAPPLGSLVPNTILMHDDGTGGDERAGDGVWSYAARVPAGTRLFYVYTNSGARGRWEGLDVPHIRQIEVPPAAAQPIFLPIETFGRIYMQADNWHTDAVGYDLIARAAVRVIRDLRAPGRTAHAALPPPAVSRR